jgi:2-polyprenyl-6-methoxyphenol hydroxylase-like FAD-dependent oxidoreductase
MAVSSSGAAIQLGWSASSDITGSAWQIRTSPCTGVDAAGSNMHRVEYHQVLLDEARRLGAKINLNCDVISVETDTPSVTLSSGKVYTGDVVVGADGKKNGFVACVILLTPPRSSIRRPRLRLGVPR